MTVKEFYEWARGIGAENAIISLSYQCNDDWYNFEGNIEEDDLDIGENEVIINIVN